MSAIKPELVANLERVGDIALGVVSKLESSIKFMGKLCILKRDLKLFWIYFSLYISSVRLLKKSRADFGLQPEFISKGDRPDDSSFSEL